MISKKYKYAVVGASNNPAKYGHIVFRDLQEARYDVVPVNPKGGELLGIKVEKSLKNISPKPDVVITVVPPKITEKIVKEALSLGIMNVWLQPGSENNETISFCQKNGISCIYNACIMVQRRAEKT